MSHITEEQLKPILKWAKMEVRRFTKVRNKQVLLLKIISKMERKIYSQIKSNKDDILQHNTPKTQ